MKDELRVEFENNVIALFATKGKISQQDHALMGIISEVGELTDCFKQNFVYGKELDKVNLEEELGDILFYITALSQPTVLALPVLKDYSKKEVSKIHKENKPDPIKTIGYCSSMSNLASKLHLVTNSPKVKYIDMRRCCYNYIMSSITLIETIGDSYGISMNKIMKANISKLSKRYPDGKFKKKHATSRLDKG